MKIIKIESCFCDCPLCDIKGEGNDTLLVCNSAVVDDEKEIGLLISVATVDGFIPEWCPLQESE